MPTPRLPFYSAKNHSAKLNPSNSFLKVSRNAVHKTTGKCFRLIQNLLHFLMATTISCSVKLLGPSVRAAWQNHQMLRSYLLGSSSASKLAEQRTAQQVQIQQKGQNFLNKPKFLLGGGTAKQLSLQTREHFLFCSATRRAQEHEPTTEPREGSEWWQNTIGQ